MVANFPAIEGGITAAEFKIDNLPTNDGYPSGTVTVTPTSDLVIGDLWWDFSIAWAEPVGVDDHFAIIAEIELLMFDPTWIGSDRWIQIAPGDDCGCMVLVDSNFEIVDIDWGDVMILNCEVNCADCMTATAVSSWSEIKLLF